MSSVNKGTEISFSPLGLQTILFALSGSGSFIFALGGIEFIGYLEAEALEIPVNPIFHIGIYAVSLAVNVMVSVSFKKDLERRALICPSVRVTKNPCREAVERYPSILKNQPLGRLKLLSRLI